MLIRLLSYAGFGLVLAYPFGLWLRWLLRSSRRWSLPPVYLRPYLPADQRALAVAATAPKRRASTAKRGTAA